ncbi:hypothetical protein JHK85_001024 [Glycine max]|nr:hypothetical protein JHK85_001024 [Glycine max]KAG5088377.1 hypothetical protein JHK86_000989 [Glycine max]
MREDMFQDMCTMRNRRFLCFINPSNNLAGNVNGVRVNEVSVSILSENEKEEQWSGAMTNLMEMASNLDSPQKLLLTKVIFINDNTFSQASLAADQARFIKTVKLPPDEDINEWLVPPKITCFIDRVTLVPLEKIEEPLKAFVWEFDKV